MTTCVVLLAMLAYGQEVVFATTKHGLFGLPCPNEDVGWYLRNLSYRIQVPPHEIIVAAIGTAIGALLIFRRGMTLRDGACSAIGFSGVSGMASMLAAVSAMFAFDGPAEGRMRLGGYADHGWAGAAEAARNVFVDRDPVFFLAVAGGTAFLTAGGAIVVLAIARGYAGSWRRLMAISALAGAMSVAWGALAWAAAGLSGVRVLSLPLTMASMPFPVLLTQRLIDRRAPWPRGGGQ